MTNRDFKDKDYLETYQKKLKENGESFYLVLPKIDELARKAGANLYQVFDAVRADWISSLPSKLNLSKEEQSRIVAKEEFLKRCEAIDADLPKPNQKLSRLAVNYGIDADVWRNDENFVFKYRLHLPIRGIYDPHLAPNYDLFFKLFGKFYERQEEEIKKVLENFDLSIRPLNLCSSIVSSTAIKNFLPEIGQKFQKDPFGVQRYENLVLDKRDGKLVYLSTRKKEYGTYLAILQTVAYCTAGCAKCYRGEQTRQLQKFTAIKLDGREEIVYFLSPAEQIERLVRRWNEEKDPPNDILFSGGEPMDISVPEWLRIIEALKKAKFLKYFRICTGDLFLGQPFRLIEPNFLEALKNFSEETGKSIKFATNLPHPKFITPEAIYTIMRLHKLDIGIEIQSQTSLEEGTLCFQREIQEKIKKFRKEKLSDEQMIGAWAHPLAKSFKLLQELCIKISILADRPYKFIHDMQQSVSVIYNTILFSLLCEPHVGITDSAVRPASFAIFVPHVPNINLNFHTLQYLANIKGAYETDFKNKKIKMKIPHAVGTMAQYEEPYWEGINDKETLQRIANIDFWGKLRKRVKELAEKD